LELSWDQTKNKRDLSKTIQESLECVYIRDSSPTGHKRTTVLRIEPSSIKAISELREAPHSPSQGFK